MLRFVQIVSTFCIAAFFTLVVVGNVFSYETNRAFVERVMSMDTTFNSPSVMWRAITVPWAHDAAYILIIAWEGFAGLCAWIGFFTMVRAARTDPGIYDRAKGPAILGCLAGFFLYFFGFVVIASEWFAMWQSKTANAQDTAIGFAALNGLVLVFLLMREPRPN